MKKIFAKLIFGLATLVGFTASAAPVTGFRPGVNVDGINITYTFNPISGTDVNNPVFNQQWYADLFGGTGTNGIVQKGLAPKAIRFMDWNQTNGNNQVNWGDRQTSLANVSYGVPYETQIALANKTGATPWFNVPVKATTDYNYQLGKLVGAKFKGGLVKWEFSNELWNGGDGSQGTYNLLQARSEGYTGPSDTEKMAQRAAWVGYNNFQAFKQGLVDAGYKGKAEWEWGGFVANPYWTFWGMEELKRRGVNPSSVGIRNAIAPYAPGSETDIPDITSTTSYADGITKIKAWMNNSVIPWIRSNKTMSQSYNLLGIDGYESRVGSMYAIQRPEMASWWIGLQNDPGMKDLQDWYWRQLAAEFGTDATVNIFGFYGISYSQYGQWPLLNYGGANDQLNNPLTSYNYAGVQGVVDFAAVPEPSLMSLVGLSLVLLKRRK